MSASPTWKQEQEQRLHRRPTREQEPRLGHCQQTSRGQELRQPGATLLFLLETPQHLNKLCQSAQWTLLSHAGQKVFQPTMHNTIFSLQYLCHLPIIVKTQAGYAHGEQIQK